MVGDGLSVREAVLEPGMAELPALFEQGRAISFGELAALVARRADELAAAGVSLGSRVAMRAACEVGTIVTFFALLERGAAFVPIHPRLTEAEEQVILDDVCPHVRLVGTSIERLTTKDIECEAVADADPAVAIVYTSGTTGRPKGAVLSRQAFVASAEASAQNLGWRTNDRWLVCMPLAHVGGLSILTRCLSARRPIVVEPRFDPQAVLQSIRTHAATQISIVPTMLHALLDADREHDLQRLRFMLVGGAAASPRLLERAARQGLLAITTYGLTEACSQVTCQPLRAPGTTEPGSGRALPGVQVRITRPEGGLAEPNEVGCIEVRGPTLMRGYWSGPDKPLVQPHAAGWFVTGDLGALDESGRLFVHARRTDLIVTGGENVYPAELEQAFERAEGIAEAVVFGVPDDRWGQVVAVALVLSGHGSPTEDELARNAILQVSTSLASHKRPRLFAVMPALPRNATGKIDRALVCREATTWLRPAPGR